MHLKSSIKNKLSVKYIIDSDILKNEILRKCLIIICQHASAELTTRITQTRIELIRAVVTIISRWTVAHVHIGQRLTADALGAVLTRIRRTVIDGVFAERACVADETTTYESIEYALTATVVLTW